MTFPALLRPQAIGTKPKPTLNAVSCVLDVAYGDIHSAIRCSASHSMPVWNARGDTSVANNSLAEVPLRTLDNTFALAPVTMIDFGGRTGFGDGPTV